MPLDNLVIARVLGEIGDLLEIKGENPFKIRAYRNAASLAAHSAEALGSLDEKALRALPGIGKDLAARIGEIAATGTCQVLADLAAEFPPGLLDLMRLQGVGPKTVALLYRELRIGSPDDLEAAIKAGRLRGLRGFGPKKEQLLLTAIAERRQNAGRHLLADAAEVAADLVAWLHDASPALECIPVGSVRRGVETCGDIDILAVGGDQSVMERFVAHRRVDRVLGRGDTKASVLLTGGFQADLRLVAAESRGAALQYFTGSKAHNIALRDLALERGLRLNEYGLYRARDDVRLAGETEEGLYEALGLAWVPPELRENRGEIEAARDRTLPALVERRHLRGDVHMHTTETDGKDTLEDMVAAARAAGLEYVAITDHSKALTMANGLDEERVAEFAARIRALDKATRGLRVLAGIECDILPDGRLDLADDCLAGLDLVIASVHSALSQDEAQMTARLVKAIEHPHVDILGHPTGRLLRRRDASRLDIERVIAAAAANRVALEINSQVDRLDLSDAHARLARDRGVKIVISSDAHARQALGLTAWGVIVARRAWLEPDDVLNTLPVGRFLSSLRRAR
ncbi:MAG: DNA polymerase/3'-5' exonuclease PolX [Acidobacteriota bacterium]